ncbi:MAG: glycosyltransferase family 4 protein [Bacteroidaceae bacterium]|nr:glycosyltransferase family 4 protein [Bacteroidaceae bacterium]
MRVLIINTTERQGGPAIAAYRLTEALKNNGIKAKMLVRRKSTGQVTTVLAERSAANRLTMLWERLSVALHTHFRRNRIYAIDLGHSGGDITELPEFKQADVIHLHWINDGMLSLPAVEKIITSGKPIVWTLHDMWPFTGVCHYAHDCDHYTEHCHDCPQLNSRKYKDTAYRVFERKATMLQGTNIQFVACSRWLGNMAMNSRLLQGRKIVCIPNTYNSNLFRPRSKQQAREVVGLPLDKRLVVFSSHTFTDERKGYHYLKEALKQLVATHPEWKERLGVVLIGKDITPSMYQELPLEVYPLNYIADEKRIVEIYNAVDLLAIPSLQDNLPNTVLEAMACGVPCIGFNVGGIPEMIDHLHNGYVAEYKNVADFAAGIHWLLTEGEYDILSREAARKAANTYGENSVAMKYISIYNRMTGKNE